MKTSPALVNKPPDAVNPARINVRGDRLCDDQISGRASIDHMNK